MIKNRLLCWLIAITLMMCILPATAIAIGSPSEVFQGRVFVSDQKTPLAPGATQHTITTNNESGSDQNIDFFCDADLAGTSTLKVMACYAGYTTSDMSNDNTNIDWQMMAIPDQAAAAQKYFDAHPDKYPNYKVVGAIVGDTYNMGTGQPTGVLVMGDVTYQKPNGSYYFAIDKNGKAMITNQSDTSGLSSAVGGMGLIVQGGKNVAATGSVYTDSSFSRAAVGVTSTGNVITFCTYGNSYPISCGYTWSEVADYLIAQGCADALMLDGSGSAEWCARNEGENNVESISHPSDGSSRAVGSCLLIVSTVPPDGVFARASVSPNATVFTPKSSVQFTATGADSAGNAVGIPDGATWSLSADSADKGEIAANGVFTSNGKTGDVTAQIMYNGNVAGSSIITIAAPDSITFAQDSQDVGRGHTTDLGLQVRYKKRDIVLKAGDLNWTLTNSDSTSKDSIGTYDANTNLFTGSATVTCTGTITIASAIDPSISGSVRVNIGKDPVKALDFEAIDGKTLAEYYGLDENNYVVGRSGGDSVAATGLLTRLQYGRGGNETARVVSVKDGYPVHTGENALQINYDFSKCGSGITEGANVGCTDEIPIPGSPTAIGLWVYVPKNTPNLWLRVRLKITPANGGAASYTQFDFGPQINTTFPVNGTYGGLTVCEEGTWVFCQAGLSSYAGCSFAIPTGEAIRLMRTDAPTRPLTYGDNTATQSHGKYLRDGTEIPIDNCKGTVYFDDMMFIYGSVNEDTNAPSISSATYNENNVNVANLTDGMNIDWNLNATSHAFQFFFKDAMGASGNNPVGMDYDNCYLYLDGKVMTGEIGTVVDTSASSITTYASLSNGDHSIRLLLSDLNGNRTSQTYHFTINNSEIVTPVYSVGTSANYAPLGGTIPVTIHANDRTGLKSVTTTLEVENRYAKGGYAIEAAEGYTASTTVYDEVNNTITFTVSGDGTLTGDGDVATINFAIDRSLPSGSYFTFAATAGLVIANNVSSNFYPGFTAPQKRLAVEAPYVVTSDVLYAGMKDGALYVKDLQGNGVANATIYKIEGGNETPLGIADDSGKLVLSDEILASAKTFSVYAQNDDGISFNAAISINAVTDKSSQVIFTAVNNAATVRKLSWLTPLSDTMQLRFAESTDGLESAQPVTANTKVLRFKGTGIDSATVAQANSVTLDNLTAGKTYYYQYSSDGKTWTEAASFTMPANKDVTNLFVLGDVQARDTTNISTILGILKKGNYDLGIQTGDLVDAPYYYDQWLESTSLFAGLGDQDMLYALGNHENSMGDDGSLAQAIYQLKSKEYYSVQYNDVYVATISYSSADGYRTALNWLVQDAKASNARWKILVTHQPTYYTNSTATDNLGMDKLFPSYLQQAGINIVFSGHDHSYARTAALTDGKRCGSYDAYTESCLAGDGIVYYICGSSGEKSYPIDRTLDFDFRVLNDSFNAIYLTASATKDSLVIDTYDLVNGKPSKIDSFTMYADSCVQRGHHSFDENSVYDPTSGTLACTKCGKSVPVSETKYTGYAAYGKGQVYLFNGAVQTGWVTIGENIVYADADGLLHKTVSFTTETCTEFGTRMAYCEDYNLTKSYGTTIKNKGHVYDASPKCINTYYDENHVLHECGWEGVDIGTLDASLGYNYGFYDGNPRRPSVTVKNGEYVLINQSTYGDYVAYYSDNSKIGVATIRLAAYNSYYGNKVLHFEVRPSNVATITSDKVTANSVMLTWEESKGAEHYAVYQQTASGGWNKIADTEDEHLLVEGLSPDTNYTFIIRPYAVVENTAQRIDGSYNTTFWSTQYSSPLTVRTSDSDDKWDGSSVGSTVTVPVSSNEGSVKVEADIKGNTATVSVTDTQLKEIASGTNTTGTVKVDVSSLDVDTIVVPAKVVSAANTASGITGLELATKTGTVTLDKTALSAVSGKGDVKIGIETVDNAKLTDSQKAVLGNQAGTAAVVDVNVYVNGTQAHTFNNGKVQVSVPYTLKSGESAGSITVWFAKDDGTIQPMNSVYANGVVTFTTVHLSEYLIVSFPFTDVDQSAWYYGNVAYAYNNGLFSGTEATTFSPDVTMSRGMLVTVLYKFAGSPTITGSSKFTDVSDSNYYAKAVAWASDNKLVSGVGDGKFDPSAHVTREQMVAILYKYAQFKGYDISVGEDPNIYSDVLSVSKYAVPAMQWACGAGVIQGSGNKLMPKEGATRAQVSAIMQSFIKSTLQ